MARFAEGVHGAWTALQIEHVRRCDFCQRLVALEWNSRHPEVKTLAAYAANPEDFPYAAAMRRHLERDACRRCALLSRSPLVKALAALVRLDKKPLEVIALGLEARLRFQQMAPPQEEVYAYEADGGSSLTLHQGGDDSLLVSANINPMTAPSGRVLLEIIGEHGYRATDLPAYEDSRVCGSVQEARHEFGEHVAMLAASASPESLEELATWMIDPRADLRVAAAQAAGALGAAGATPEIVSRLIELQRDQDERVRKAAAEAVVRCGKVS